MLRRVQWGARWTVLNSFSRVVKRLLYFYSLKVNSITVGIFFHIACFCDNLIRSGSERFAYTIYSRSVYVNLNLSGCPWSVCASNYWRRINCLEIKITKTDVYYIMYTFRDSRCIAAVVDENNNYSLIIYHNL